jgi:anti-sigma factor ChrR (cupin superfamily)
MSDTRMNQVNPEFNAEELAALYVAGALSSEERDAVEAALKAGHPELRAEVARLEVAANMLINSVPSEKPSASVRQRLMSAIQPKAAPTKPVEYSTQQVWKNWSGDQMGTELFTLRADQGDWEPTGVAGVEVRRLFVDRANNRMTAMFRMAPGTAYPQHVHDGPEECYVLQGELHVGDELVMKAGDYQRAVPGSEHALQWTETGCLLLVTSSLSDELH